MIFVSPNATRLNPGDFARVANTLKVEEAALRAVVEVEAKSSGFDKKRRPKMLFEPHVFYRCLPQRLRTIAVGKGLAYPNWRPRSYPNDSYPLLEKAMLIDPAAALKACSWGLGQVLGENAEDLGYADVETFVAEAVQSEGHQLKHMALFIAKNGLDGPMRKKNWTAFARGYNGPSHEKHDYDGRLAKAYAKWSKKAPAKPRKLQTDLTETEVLALQLRLKELKYQPGMTDGQWGSTTLAALVKFQAENGLETTGVLDPATKEALEEAPPMPVSDSRREAKTVPGSRTIETADILKGLGAGGAGLTLAGEVAEKATGFMDTAEQVSETAQRGVGFLSYLEPVSGLVRAYPLATIGVLCLILVVGGVLITRFRLQDHREGKLA